MAPLDSSRQLLNSKGKILVIRGGAIGDFVLTLPVLSALRAQFPSAQLDVLGYPHIAQLALAGGLADHLQSIEARPLAGFFARAGVLDPQLSNYFAEFGVIISYLYDPDEIFQTNVGRCSKAQFIVGPHRPNEQSSAHATSAFLKPLERLAIFDAEPMPRLRLESSAFPARNGSQHAGALRLAVHPGSGSELKNWPEPKWTELLIRLRDETKLELALIGGEAEGDRLQALARLIPSERLTLAQSLPLRDVASLLTQCRAFIGHDSGITHLAAAVGLKGVALWGKSNPNIWRPLSPRFHVLQETEQLAALSVDRVFESTVSLVS